MSEVPEAVKFDATIDSQNWRIIVSREFVEDDLSSSGDPRTSLEEWVEHRLATLIAIAKRKIARGATQDDAVLLTTEDRQPIARSTRDPESTTYGLHQIDFVEVLIPNGSGFGGQRCASLDEAVRFISDVSPNADMARIRLANGRILLPAEIAPLRRRIRSE